MIVEHLTYLGNSVARNTDNIEDIVKHKLDVLTMNYESQSIILPLLPFKLKITTDPFGCIFDVQKQNSIAITNVCCFGDTRYMLPFVEQLANTYAKSYGITKNVVKPSLPYWIYSVIINPSVLSPEEATLAREVELYTYERLFKAWSKSV